MDTLEHLEDSPTITLEELQEIAIVTDEDLQAAAKTWRDNPPNERWKFIMDSEVTA